MQHVDNHARYVMPAFTVPANSFVEFLRHLSSGLALYRSKTAHDTRRSKRLKAACDVDGARPALTLSSLRSRRSRSHISPVRVVFIPSRQLSHVTYNRKISIKEGKKYSQVETSCKLSTMGSATMILVY